jgi:hypothetical protein
MDSKTAGRLMTLRQASELLLTLSHETGTNYDQARNALTKAAREIENQAALAWLKEQERKPGQRVAMSGRRKNQ